MSAADCATAPGDNRCMQGVRVSAADCATAPGNNMLMAYP